jgi:hypothetical protein
MDQNSPDNNQTTKKSGQIPPKQSSNPQAESLRISAYPKPRFHITDFSKKPIPSLLQKIQQVYRSVEMKKPRIVVSRRSLCKDKIPGFQGTLFAPNHQSKIPFCDHRHARTVEANPCKREVIEDDILETDFKLATSQSGKKFQHSLNKSNNHRLDAEFSKTSELFCENRHKLNKTSHREVGFQGDGTVRLRVKDHTHLLMKGKLGNSIWKSTQIARSASYIEPDIALPHIVGPSNTYEFEINQPRMKNKYLEYRKENREIILCVRNEIETSQARSELQTGGTEAKSVVRTESDIQTNQYSEWSSAKRYPENREDIILTSQKVSPNKAPNNTASKKLDDLLKVAQEGTATSQKLWGIGNSLNDLIIAPETTQVEKPVAVARKQSKQIDWDTSSAVNPKPKYVMYSLKYEPTEFTNQQESARKKALLGNNLLSGLGNLLAGIPEDSQATEASRMLPQSTTIDGIYKAIRGKELQSIVALLTKYKPYFLKGFCAAKHNIDQQMKQLESKAAATKKLLQESRAEILRLMSLKASQNSLVDSEVDRSIANSASGGRHHPTHIRQDVTFYEYTTSVYLETFEKLMDVLQQQHDYSPANSEELARKKIVLRQWEKQVTHSKYQMDFDSVEDYSQRPVLFLDLDETLVSTLTSKKRKPGFSLFKPKDSDAMYVGLVCNTDTSPSKAIFTALPGVGFSEIPFSAVRCL